MKISDMQSYYNSIKTPDTEYITIRGRDGEEKIFPINGTEKLYDRIENIFIFLVLLSVIPLIPMALYLFLTYSYNYFPVIMNVPFLSLKIPSFLLIQFVMIILSVILLAAFEFAKEKYIKKESKKSRKRTFSQLCFIDLYKAVESLKTYQFNNVEENLDISKRAISSFVTQYSYFFNHAKNLPGFVIGIENSKLISVIESFKDKILPRIKGEKDLIIIVGVLEDFAVYIFSNLPEIKVFNRDEELEQLRAEGALALERVAKILNNLSKYDYQPLNQGSQKTEGYLTRFIDFQLIIKFIMYLVIISLLLLITTLLSIKIFNIEKLDILIPALITTAFGAAAALTNKDKKSKKNKQQEEDTVAVGLD